MAPSAAKTYLFMVNNHEPLTSDHDQCKRPSEDHKLIDNSPVMWRSTVQEEFLLQMLYSYFVF
ncbi:hypothetical protein DPMN_079449 [Dreissena polymorpha]|uniref:Uncharacterized protein n=1 Tax=Dreissena polymorpha TaxID=45954 RepID=A0A9D3YT69_DREPO|nr:hypothetical protein DPMN_079449 [Dreissena polymorpha]